MDRYLFLNRSFLNPQGMENVRLAVSPVQKDTANNPLFHEDFFSDPPRRW